MDKNDIIRMARDAGIAKHGLGWTCWEGQLERFAALVAAAEREACAAILDANADKCIPSSTFMQLLRSNAAAIRARGNHANG